MDRKGALLLAAELNGTAYLASPPDQHLEIDSQFAERTMNAPNKACLSGLILVMNCAVFCGTLAAKDKPPAQYQIPIPAAPDFSSLNWLEGRWNGTTVPPGPPGEIQITASPDLEKHIMIVRGEVSLDATPTVPATRESWMGVLSANGSDFKLRVFSSTGFITSFRVIVEGTEIHLNPEGGDSPPPGWLFRHAWSRTAADELIETVEVAPPGKAFFNYYTARLSRVVPPPKTTPAPASPPVKTTPTP